jgi:hypothetical protein
MYLGCQRVIKQDIREEDGPTTFVSAGNSDDYKLFKWRVDTEGRIILASSPDSAKMPNKELYLAAHRTFQFDIRGNNETYAIVTSFKGHEALWKWQRVGSLNDAQYNI